MNIEPEKLFENEIMRLQSEILFLKGKQKENILEIENLKMYRQETTGLVVKLMENEKFLKEVIMSQIKIIEHLREYCE